MFGCVFHGSEILDVKLCCDIKNTVMKFSCLGCFAVEDLSAAGPGELCNTWRGSLNVPIYQRLALSLIITVFT
uniref:Uncharacterized protein n=1 Tax=Anguilla anguilla TaxID=7936 RepID=A0A0E9V3Q0_ANGAN